MTNGTSTQRGMGGVIVMVASLLLIGAALVIWLPKEDDRQIVSEPTVAPTLTPLPTLTLTATPTLEASVTPSPTSVATQLPTADAQIVSTSVAVAVDNAAVAGEVDRDANPYTIDRAQIRDRVIQYEVQYGDSLNAIAQKYGLTLETLIWSNGSFYVNAMRPGLVLNILPVNGAIHKVEDPITVKDLAEEYQVEPSTIINSEFNALNDAVPDSVLPVGLQVVVEGGIGKKEPIYWDPRGGSGTSVNPSESSGGIFQGTGRFGAGQLGSCGVQAIYDGTMPITKPVSGYVTTQDFSWTHSGIDLSAVEGTPIHAVGAGTVIFVGWSDWGYGYSVVVAHGPVMTLYAHMNGPGFTWCGKHVEAGEHIGNVGSTGRSSGPHLHFEVRDANGTPQDPRAYLGFAACSSEWCIY